MNAEIDTNFLDKIKNSPTTRYQGSKRRILDWIYDNLKTIDFDDVLDAFGGTASVSYLFKLMGKKVTFNDILLSNYFTGMAIIENNDILLDSDDVKFILNDNGFDYPTFIQDTFKGIYFLDKENRWLDMTVTNIEKLSDMYNKKSILLKKRSLAYHVLFQSCLSKRPFNMFHRKNLYLRTSNVERSFGNKKTWDKSFKKHFLNFNSEISKKIFSNGQKNKVVCKDAFKINSYYDLVYLDPPYMRNAQYKPINYFSLYHFLEGIVRYNSWNKKINQDSTNKSLKLRKNPWNSKDVLTGFDRLFKNFKDSIIVVSYGEPGKPNIKEIEELLCQYKSRVFTHKKRYNYKLNHRNGDEMNEVLIIGM